MTSETNKTFRKFLGFSIGPVVNVLIGLISVPITTRILVPSSFGQAEMYTLFRGLLSPFVMLGLSYAYSLEYSYSENKKKLIRHCFVPTLFILMVIGVFLVLFRERISISLFGEPHPELMILLIINLLTQAIFQYSALIIRMKEKAKQYSMFQIIQRILSFVFTITLLLIYGNRFEMVIWGQILTYITLALIIVPFTIKEWSIIGKIDLKMLKSLLKIGLPMIPAGLALWLIAYVDKMALRYWSDFQQIGYYSGAMKIVTLVAVIQRSFQNFWIPTLIRWNKEDKVSQLVEEIGTPITFLGVFAAMVIIISKNIIIHYLGPDFYPSMNILPFLLFIPVMNIVVTIYTSGIVISKKSYFQPLILFIIALIDIILNAFLVPRMGGVGAAIATAVSYSIYVVLAARVSKYIWRKISSRTINLSLIVFFIMAFFTLIPKFKWYFQLVFILLVMMLNKSSIQWLLGALKSKIPLR